MYLVPILMKPVNELKTGLLQQIWIFLERNGTYCMEISSLEEAKEFAEENGFPLMKEPVVVGDLIFLFIEPKCKELQSFYTWGEIHPGDQPMREVWRPFLWVDAVSDMWGTNQYLNDIQLTPTKSVSHILTLVASCV